MRYSERSLIGYQGNLNAHWDKPSPLRRSQWRGCPPSMLTNCSGACTAQWVGTSLEQRQERRSRAELRCQLS